MPLALPSTPNYTGPPLLPLVSSGRSRRGGLRVPLTASSVREELHGTLREASVTIKSRRRRVRVSAASAETSYAGGFPASSLKPELSGGADSSHIVRDRHALCTGGARVPLPGWRGGPVG